MEECAQRHSGHRPLGYNNEFLQSLGLVRISQSPPNFGWIGKDEYVFQEVEDVQGTFAGGQTLVLTLLDPACLAMSHVTRRDGWVHTTSPLPVAVVTVPGLIDLVLLQLPFIVEFCAMVSQT